ncbi:MAG TPA: hypothetical protein VF196_04540 [Casimicrobiaceae bacterium]
MRQGLGWALFAVMAAVAPLAQASYHTFEIAELYSNADGTIQFVLLHESAGANGQDLLAGHTLSATHVGTTKTFVFPASLPSTGTAGRYVLVATQGYVDAAASLQPFASVYPDYVVPNQFLPTDGGVVNYAGVDEVSFGPLPGDGSLALFTPTGAAAYLATNEARNFAGAAGNLPALAVTAVEYYNASLRHYFISDLQPDIDALDTGRIPGWTRTGGAFYVYASSGGGVSPVCRFYIPAEHGNSHFFSASPTECAQVQSKIGYDPNYSGYILETSAAFYVYLPDPVSGACPAGTTPVYRLWNHRFDSNHRYTTDPAVKAQMQAIGYVAEGYGPDAVAMCSPI